MGVALGLCLLLCGAAHPGSFSRSRVEVRGAEVQQVLRVQVLSLVECLDIDLDDDLRLDQAEWQRAQEAVGLYLLAGYELRCNSANEPLARHIEEISLQFEGNASLPSSAWVEVVLMGEHTGAIEHLWINERLFDESEPQHIEYVSVTWVGQAPHDHVFSPDHSTADFGSTSVEGKGVLRSFFDMGWGHILSGYDHLLFLLALFVAARGIKSLAYMVTAFTVAHSITLGAAALDLVSLPARFVELSIALSIVYVSMATLLNFGRRRLWVEALGFGLLHGLGFAGFLGEALANEPGKLIPLVGFNLGVEAGQLTLVLPLAMISYMFSKRRSESLAELEPVTLVPSALGRALSGLIALAGAYWFVERAF